MQLQQRLRFTRRPSRILLRAFALLVILGGSTKALRAQATATGGASSLLSAADMLPDSVVVFAELGNVSELVDLVFEHPLREKLEQLDAFQEFKRSQQFNQFRGGLAIFEAGMGMRWRKVLEKASAGGVELAVDSETNGFVLIATADDEQIYDRLIGVLQPVLMQGGSGKFKKAEYRDVPVYAVSEDLFFANRGAQLLVTNKKELGREVLDRMLDSPDQDDSSLAFSDVYNEVLSTVPRGGDSTETLGLWGFVDVEAIRESGAAEELYSGRTDNILAEMLFGGIVANLKHTPFVRFDLGIETSLATLRIHSPHDPDECLEREYFWGADGASNEGSAPELAQPSGTMFSMSAYRDLSQMWLLADDLMQDRAVEQLAQADSQLATFFSGKDFGEDILGALGPGIQFLSMEQQFSKESPTPAIKLPAFALKMSMKEPEKTTGDFRRIFHSLIGFLNVVGAMEGQPQLDFAWDRNEKNELLSASYVPNLDEDEWAAAPIQFNFSPTLLFSGDTLIVASTRGLAETIEAGQSEPQNRAPVAMEEPTTDEEVADGKPNTLVWLSASKLHSILDSNRTQLVAQNMLENGHTKAEAEAEIGVLMEILSWVDHASLDFLVGDDSLDLQVELALDAQREDLDAGTAAVGPAAEVAK